MKSITADEDRNNKSEKYVFMIILFALFDLFDLGSP